MLGLIKNRWREARGTELRKQVEQIVRLVSSYSDDGGRQFSMVYISTLASLARNYGVIDTLSDAVKQDVAKGITLKAKEGYNRNPIAANALFLLAAGLEAATLPGEDAEMVVAYATSFSDMAEEFVTESGQGVATGVGTVSVD